MYAAELDPLPPRECNSSALIARAERKGEGMSLVFIVCFLNSHLKSCLHTYIYCLSSLLTAQSLLLMEFMNLLVQ